MADTALPLRVSNNGEGGMGTSQHQVNPGRTALRRKVTREIGIREEMRTQALQLVSNPSDHAEMSG
eukprot:2084566-Lingulodinium_polyedra.AAC.1